MSEIDICLVAARRPELIERTLASFSDRMFRHFTFRGAYVNIDPIFGDEEDLARSIECIRSHFPAAQITTPTEPQFCAAVQTNWTRSTADYVLHLEDDWVLNVDITPKILRYFDDASIAQVSFNTKEKRLGIGHDGKMHTRKCGYRVFGLKLFPYTVPAFTTSPSILRGAFAREAASLFDPGLDPEKQFFTGNKVLSEFAFPFKSFVYAVPDQFVVTDIGRAWRDERGIRKIVKGSVSSWVFSS